MRLFLALWPDDVVRARLVAAQREWVWPPRAVPVSPERLHITLHFLGEVDEAAARALAGRLPPCPAFALRLEQAALWPRGLAVREALDVPPELAQLHGALAGVLGRLGLRVEARRLRPHVTLARHAQGARPPERVAPLVWPVSGYVLVRSHAGPPLRYEPVARVGA